MSNHRFALAAACSAVLVASCTSALSTATPASVPIAPHTATPAATAAPPSVSAQSTPSVPADEATKLPKEGDLAAGRYFVDGRDEVNGKRLSFTIPEGWTGGINLVGKNADTDSQVSFDTWVVTDIFGDACHWAFNDVADAGTTPDEFMNAVSAQKNRTASPRKVTILDGHPAEQITLITSADIDPSTCTNGVLRYWPGPGPDFTSGTCCNRSGNIDVVYAVDVGGNRTIVIARHYPESTAQDIAELQSIVDSVHIDP